MDNLNTSTSERFFEETKMFRLTGSDCIPSHVSYLPLSWKPLYLYSHYSLARINMLYYTFHQQPRCTDPGARGCCPHTFPHHDLCPESSTGMDLQAWFPMESTGEAFNSLPEDIIKAVFYFYLYTGKGGWGFIPSNYHLNSRRLYYIRQWRYLNLHTICLFKSI